jgi:hypothetical protein
MNRVSFFLVPFSLLLGLCNNLFSSGVGGYSASNTFTVNSGNSTAPTYKIASASIAGDAVYSGVVSSSDSSSVTFATGTDENNATTYPFAGANVFNPNAQIPNLTANGTGSSVTVSYPGGYDATGSGFASAPEIIIDAPSGGGDTSTATATVSSGEITGITVTAGSGYTQAPAVTVVGGPHFLRNTMETSANYGRYFLITANTTTSLTIDMTRIAGSESANASSFFAVGDTIEVVPAPTLGSVFGLDITDLSTNWSYGIPADVDWVYLYDSDTSGYYPYAYAGTAYEPAWSRGWYSVRNAGLGVQSSKVIYPDEAFIIAKRTSNNVTFTFEGTVQTNDQKMFLPEGNNQVLLNNPYGTDLFLGELIPSTSIGSGASKFNPGTSASAANTDTVSFLQSDGSWKTFFYHSGTNPSVTAMHVIGTRRPLAAGGGSTASTMDSNDFYIGTGAITDLDSCTDAAGSNTLTNSNDGNYTKITLASATSDLKGFQITLNSVQGYKLNDDGSKEANASTSVEVESPARGTIIYSNLIGSHEIVGSGSGYVVIEKQRDVNLKADEQDASASNATVTWAIGSLGSGYSANATFYCVGGGASTNAKGTITTGGTISVTTAGAGYTASPQVVVTGGGWQTASSGTSARGDYPIGSSDGVLLYRGYSSGAKTFVVASNPNQ